MFDYAALDLGTVRPLIREFGQLVTLKTPGVDSTPNDDYDPVTGLPGTGGQVPPPVQVQVWGVNVGLTRDFVARVGSENIVAGDQVFLLDASVPPMANTQLVTADGIVYSIVRVETLAPAGVAVMHEVQVRP